ncbi:HipA family kinase [Candidatus Poriferisocius sp.]|uniref:HipA family kinase n=1 Tax=Candidatus Poriferisocius sp. TaxID=3101276 RepID=UPI003B5D05A2
MAVDRADWSGRIAGTRRSGVPGPTIEVLLQPSPRGGSGTFLAADSDGLQWWVKPLNNLQGERVAVTEAIVGVVGGLIGAPVCETAVVTLPEELRGWEFRPGSQLEPGLAHASRAVDSAVEDRQLLHRDRDDNGRRHAGVFALYDWCWGGDDQWLYSASDDKKLFSHDHGFYLPEGPRWTEHSLVERVDDPRRLTSSVDGLDASELSQLSARLRQLEADALADALRTIPRGWPVTDEELEAVGWFLQRRAAPVADRLDGYSGRA